MDPVDALAAALGVSRSRIEWVAAVEAGYGNRSYRLRYGAADFVVRIGVPAEDVPGIDRHAEQAALQAVEPWSLGPAVVQCDPRSGLLITRHLGGLQWTSREFASPAEVSRLGAVLATLHAIPPPAGLRRLDLATHVQALESRVTSVSAALRDGARRMLERLADPPACLCHNDVHAGNVVDDGTLRLLDWEYAAIGDPDFDLAGPICYHRLSGVLQQALLDAYERSGRLVHRERLTAATWLFEYVACLWQLALPAGALSSTDSPVASIRQPLAARLAQLEHVLNNGANRLIGNHFSRDNNKDEDEGPGPA